MEDHNSAEAVALRANQTDPIIMYLIVRESLAMSIGKTAAQCSHAAQMLTLQYMQYKDIAASSGLKNSEWYLMFKEWLNTSFRKVVLKADEKEWVKIKDTMSNSMVLVVDAGLTELQPNTETVIGLFPMKKSEVPKIIKRLQVLK